MTEVFLFFRNKIKMEGEEMNEKKVLLDEAAINRALTRIAHEIIETNKGAMDMVLVGIETRGVPLAHRLAEKIKMIENVEVPVEQVNITFYRDDLEKKFDQPVMEDSKLNTIINGKSIILVDDVIYTGRTVRQWMHLWTVVDQVILSLLV